jgi:hypothetical protein
MGGHYQMINPLGLNCVEPEEVNETHTDDKTGFRCCRDPLM